MEIVIDNKKFTFEFASDINMWRVFEPNLIIDKYKMDLEIHLDNFQDNTFNWDQIKNFLEYILSHQSEINECIKSTQNIFNSFIREAWKRAFNNEDFNNIIFEPSGIEYFGKTKRSYEHTGFLYDIFFDPIDLRDVMI